MHIELFVLNSQNGLEHIGRNLAQQERLNVLFLEHRDLGAARAIHIAASSERLKARQHRWHLVVSVCGTPQSRRYRQGDTAQQQRASQQHAHKSEEQDDATHSIAEVSCRNQLRWVNRCRSERVQKIRAN